MTSGNAYPNQPDPDTSRERMELETRVLAAALRQSLERGDTVGSSHAHQQIFILLKASQEMGWEEPISLPPELMIEKDVRRPMPDIDWGAPDDSPIMSAAIEGFSGFEQASASDYELVSTDEAPTEGLISLSEAAVDQFATHDLQAIEGSEESDVQSDVQPAVESAVQPAVDSSSLDDSATESSSEAGANQEPVSTQLTNPSQPLAIVPAFALVSVPTFGSSTPASGAAAVLDFYLRLQVSQIADFASIHKSFLRKVRPLLRQYASGTFTGQAKKDLLLSLQSLWIAHDILCDPVTRTDYDFRRMGLRGGVEENAEGKASVANRPQLRIGELLLCAGLLETTELEIAADMHKAMPELMFGAFLVKQGFIEEDDLNCVLLGQQLLKTGGITAAQFQESMSERSNSGKDFGDVLVARRYLSHLQLQDAYRHQMDDTLPRLPAVVATVSLEDSAADVAKALGAEGDESEYDSESTEESSQASSEHDDVSSAAEEHALSPSRPRELINSSPSLNIGNAVPSWKDQLDWDSPQSDDAVASAEGEAHAQPLSLPLTQAGATPSLASLYDSGSSRADTADLTPHASAASHGGSSPPSRFEQGKKKSLTDLMAELEPARPRLEEPRSSDISAQSPFASIWAESSQSDSDTSDEVQSGYPQLDIALPPETVVSDALLPDAMPSPVVPPAIDFLMDALETAEYNAAKAITQDDFAPPSLEHDEDLSQVEEEFAALDAAADEALQINDQAEIEVSVSAPLIPEQQQKESGSWQIVSVPASALASLLLDDEPEAGNNANPVPSESRFREPSLAAPEAAPEAAAEIPQAESSQVESSQVEMVPAETVLPESVLPETAPPEPVKERRQLKTSFANDRPSTAKPNNDNTPPGGDRRSKKRKTR
ncbi:hypothetical protein BH11CYA1_BH11CYA1_17240 [soil metagenome]